MEIDSFILEPNPLALVLYAYPILVKSPEHVLHVVCCLLMILYSKEVLEFMHEESPTRTFHHKPFVPSLQFSHIYLSLFSILISQMLPHVVLENERDSTIAPPFKFVVSVFWLTFLLMKCILFLSSYAYCIFLLGFFSPLPSFYPLPLLLSRLIFHTNATRTGALD